MEGWIKLHRQLSKWEWYDDSKTVHLWVHMLLKANHKKKVWHGVEVNPGQFITSRDRLSIETGISLQSIRTILNRLKSTNQITIKSTNRFTIVSICKWEDYQVAEDCSNQQNNQLTNNQSTSNQPATNQQLTTNKNDNKVKNEKECEEIYKAYPRKVGKGDAIKAIQKALKIVEHEDLLDAVEEYTEATKNKDRKFIPHPATWFNQQRWEDDRSEWYGEQDEKPQKEEYYNNKTVETTPQQLIGYYGEETAREKYPHFFDENGEVKEECR